jgi:isocitrate dehydrogenase
VHGSAPKYAGQDVANPSALILSAVLMLRHVGQTDVAARVEGALLAAFADGCHTRDVAGDRPLSTSGLADAVIERLDRDWPVRERAPLSVPADPAPRSTEPARRVVGIDVFVEWGGTPDPLGRSLTELAEGSAFSLKMISNRGTMVYPSSGTNPATVDHFRCRFRATGDAEPTDAEILDLVARVASRHRWMHLEKLQEFDGAPGFTRAQGEDA